MTQQSKTRFYIDGTWVAPLEPRAFTLINPATEEPAATIELGGHSDVDRAVDAAKQAFPNWSESPKQVRINLFERILGKLEEHATLFAEAVTRDIGAPISLARKAHAPLARAHFKETLRVLKDFSFESAIDGKPIGFEAAGVCALITPWNWPYNQIASKVASALAAGCTVILKPSEFAPTCAHVFAEILHQAGVPQGVFNLVHGDGPIVGERLCTHPDVDLISFTGSTRAGIEITRAGAGTMKRLSMELGGKSPNIILDDANFEKAVRSGTLALMNNSGQSCNAPSRMLVPSDMQDEAVRIAVETLSNINVGDPLVETTTMGPLANKGQFEKTQNMIEVGISEGANLAAGGLGRPTGLDRGFYARPTIFKDVDNAMTIAQEEIFGPVLCIIPFGSDEEAINIANDTPYGLSAYIQSSTPSRARELGAKIRAGAIHINNVRGDISMPFGGYKQSGFGREWGVYGLHEFLEVKAYIAGAGSITGKPQHLS